MIDCLLIGYNDSSFPQHVETTRKMGADSVSFRDMNLGFVEYEGKPHRALDALTAIRSRHGAPPEKPFHNADVLWPVISYLGTYLHRRGYSFDYVNLFQMEQAALAAKLIQNEYRLIVITTTIYISVHPILEVVSFIRRYNDKVRIAIGGPFISKQRESLDSPAFTALLEYLDADFYVTSREGEGTLVKLLAALRSGGGHQFIDNLAYRSKGRYVVNAANQEANSIAENRIEYGLFGRERIGPVVALRTAKSCPFACAFCGFPLRSERYDYLDAAGVEGELNALREIGGVGTINFLDDTFNVPKQRFTEILRMMIRNDYGFRWHSFFRCDYADAETIGLMRRAGCTGVFLGIESVNDMMLRRMRKTATRQRYEEAIPLLHEAGISTFVSLIFGFPGETAETVQESVDFLERFRPDFFRPQVWWCDAITPIWGEREQHGIHGQGYNWVHNTMDASTACGLFERSFFEVKNSVWVPEPGFNPYAMYYLMERGMSLDQVKRFLRAFNACVAGKFASAGAYSSAALDELVAASCYDFAPQPRERTSAAAALGRFAAESFQF
jgi:anaerobic magnesium-protoporphyrin IX monomethyl ester cyclase